MNVTWRKRDYSLTGSAAIEAVAKGLAAAEWYHTDIPRQRMLQLIKRRDGPAIRDTLIWLSAFAACGLGGYFFWSTVWCLPFFVCYGVLYGSSTDSRWHECGHGTAFKTQWMNDVVYHIASFMIMREPTVWRWSHTRHHSDTIIVGRDPEIIARRPPNLFVTIGNFLALYSTATAIRHILLHAGGQLTADEQTFVPQFEWPKVYATARIWLAVHFITIGAAVYLRSILPLIYIGILPTMYGAWLAQYFGLTQHVGLAEDVLDHRLNSRTVYMNPIFRFLYWNMNYHVEHHMFPVVPYHALPQLHDIMLPDTPKPYASTIEAYREIIPTLVRQLKEPEWFVQRQLPSSAKPFRPELHNVTMAAQ